MGLLVVASVRVFLVIVADLTAPVFSKVSEYLASSPAGASKSSEVMMNVPVYPLVSPKKE